MTAIPLTFGEGGSGLAPQGAGRPTLATTLREIADDFAAVNTRTADNQAKLDSLITNYNAHRGAAGVHLEADSTNLVTSPVATDVTVDILAIVNDAYDMMLAHMAEAATIHPGGADTVNVMTATYPATTEAEGIALMNDIKAQYELHRANNGGAWHTNPDATNTIVEADSTDWDDLVTLANAFKNTTGFNAHVILTAGPVHGSTGVAHVITAADCGVQITALYLELNEFQTDANAHIASLGPHVNAGAANATAAATTEATAVALINGLKATLNTHMLAPDDHQDADALTAQVAGTATEYEDILAVDAEWLVAYNAHRVISCVHAKADGANAETTLGVGGAVTILTTKA